MKNEDIFKKTKVASMSLNTITVEKIDSVLNKIAEAAESNVNRILEANKLDLDRMDKSNPMYDRLMLTEDRIKGIASDIRNVAMLPSPLGKETKEIVRPNGLKIKRVSVSFGVIGVIYEARPNVTFDVFSLCFKAGSACILKGGTDAIDSNTVIVSIIKEVLREEGINENVISLLPAGREAGTELMEAVDYVDLLIPRGSKGLINYVRDNAKVNVIETGAGVVHTYFDKDGDLEKGRKIVNNGKTRRVSVCNALDCLLINKDRLRDLSSLCVDMSEKNVILYADESSYDQLIKDGVYPANLIERATEEHFGWEFQDYKMAIKTVDNVDDAISHITKYSSKHSESIISENRETLSKFVKMVDAACVYQNAPTSFTDGAQFGLGAEIGISTQKLHARGPMALDEICTYKWVIEGNGQIRS